MDEEVDLNDLIEIIQEKTENNAFVDELKEDINNGEYNIVLEKIEKFLKENDDTKNEEEIDTYTEGSKPDKIIKTEETKENVYPEELSNFSLEKDFIGVLLNDPKLMSKYYILHDECFFENKTFLEIYKGIVFTEGEAYTPYIAKEGYNFGKVDYLVNTTKRDLKDEYENNNVDMEKIYVELKKLFVSYFCCF